ncbi:hypothetical protein [Streptomyces sp. NPDC050145]|uniref:hypothetical protein n=1 Tax=Streptomyces sp. NPDC050145 TaxID=3365602 RepID=UPI0037A029D3
MTQAVRIDCTTTVTPVELPADDCHGAVRSIVGGAVNQAVYHRRALLHIYDSSTSEHPLNLAAWTLASAWRGMPLYPLHGTIVVTGRDESGEVCDLDDDLAQQVRAISAMVRETVQEWRRRPPASDEAAAQELLSYAAREIAATPAGG